MAEQFTGTQGIVDSSLYTVPGAQFKLATHPTHVPERKYPENFVHNKYFHPGTIGDVDIDELKAVCAYGVIDYNTGKRISTPIPDSAFKDHTNIRKDEIPEGPPTDEKDANL